MEIMITYAKVQTPLGTYVNSKAAEYDIKQRFDLILKSLEFKKKKMHSNVISI